MSTKKEIGKIRLARFGMGGYQDAMIGFTFDLGSSGWGCGDFRGMWAMKRTDGCKWTEEDRINQLGEACMWINQLMTDAKVQSLDELEGKPVEVIFENNTLKSWRILTEVI